MPAASRLMPPRRVAIVGATATGKTALAEVLADRFGAEIVCCDSRQVYAELEVGTGKPSPAERSARPHHLFDALRLGQPASAGWFARAAGEACAVIEGRGRLPLLVGGTGLYLRALREGLAPTPPHDPGVRARLRAELAESGPELLHARLGRVDPGSAARIAPRDRQRIARALEVFETTGRTLSWWQSLQPAAAPAADWEVLEIVVAPGELRARITGRTAWMLEHGLIEETRALVRSGSGGALGRLRAIGYDEALECLAGRLKPAEVGPRIDRRTWQLAKRQRTWFRHQLEAVRLDGTGTPPEALASAAGERLRALGLPAR